MQPLRKHIPPWQFQCRPCMKSARRHLGWTSQRTRYCQLISDVNKEKRMDWCLNQVLTSDLEFIWTYECSVQLESHRKITEAPPKVHVWGGISARGTTAVVIFTGILTATRYTDILEKALVPFVVQNYPRGTVN